MITNTVVHKLYTNPTIHNREYFNEFYAYFIAKLAKFDKTYWHFFLQVKIKPLDVEYVQNWRYIFWN